METQRARGRRSRTPRRACPTLSTSPLARVPGPSPNQSQPQPQPQPQMVGSPLLLASLSPPSSPSYLNALPPFFMVSSVVPANAASLAESAIPVPPRPKSACLRSIDVNLEPPRRFSAHIFHIHSVLLPGLMGAKPVSIPTASLSLLDVRTSRALANRSSSVSSSYEAMISPALVPLGGGGSSSSSNASAAIAPPSLKIQPETATSPMPYLALMSPRSLASAPQLHSECSPRGGGGSGKEEKGGRKKKLGFRKTSIFGKEIKEAKHTKGHSISGVTGAQVSWSSPAYTFVCG